MLIHCHLVLIAHNKNVKITTRVLGLIIVKPSSAQTSDDNEFKTLSSDVLYSPNDSLN